MNKYKTLIFSLICLPLLINSSMADDKWGDLNATYKQLITNISTEFPTPILIRINPELCTFPDCRDYKIEGNLPYKLFDLDKDGIPEYAIFIANLNQDNLNKASKIQYSDLPPRIKYNNQILINKWEICYQEEIDIICRWEDDKEKPDNISEQIFLVDLISRLDLYTIVKFNSSPAVKYFCPLVLDLDSWPKNMIIVHILGKRSETEIGVLYETYDIENIEIHNGDHIGKVINESIASEKEVYSGMLILTDSNKSIIITKPSEAMFKPSPDYFIKIKKLPNGHIQASACATNHGTELLPPKGPNAYIIFNETDKEKIIRMAINLANIPEPIVHPPESIRTKFFKGNVLPIGRPTFPEIAPKIDLKAEENFFNNITFAWMKQDGEAKMTIQSNDGTLIFEQPILLNSNSWKYPLDTYEAFVYYNPLVIANGNSSLSFDFGVPYQGTATFKDGKISFLIKRSEDSIIKYFLYLIICGLIFLFSNRHIKNLNKVFTQVFLEHFSA